MRLELEFSADYALASLENLLCILWRKHTTAEAVTAIEKHIRVLGEKHSKGMGLVTIVPESATAPSSEMRKRLADALSSASKVKGSCVCFEGSGLRATIVRSVVTGLTLLSPFPFPHKVYASLGEGVSFVNQQLDAAGAPTQPSARVVSELESWKKSLS